jgi:hypothetical protein
MLGQEGELKQSVMAILAPRLCLNRYYLAEGVRIFSQVTFLVSFEKFKFLLVSVRLWQLYCFT